MNESTLSTIRELSLSFFLAIVGLNYGYGAITSLTGSGLTLALVSIAVGVISIMVGFLVGRYAFHLNWVMLAGALCGGMTSTPGLGAATDALDSEDPAAGYGATCPFALFGMIIFTIVLHKLPML
jgi:putative transport protein